VSEADDLRKAISKRREAVTRKIARLRREQNVTKLAGSDIDPRVPHTELKAYSPQALRIVLHEYNAFMSRDVQYRAGRKGVPLSKHVVEAEANKQAKGSELAREFERSYGKIRTPHGDTIQHAQYMKGRRENADQSWSPYPDYKREARNFSSEKDLIEFDEKIAAKIGPNYEAESIKGNREWLAKIQEGMGEDTSEYDQLTDFQFMIMWQGTGFLADKGIVYETYKARNDEKVDEEPYHPATVRDSERELNRVSKWASNLPPTKEAWFQQLRKEDATQAYKEHAEWKKTHKLWRKPNY
jgi:hypothetical protein